MNHPFRADFPLLAGTDIAFLDSAATSQRPACVIQAEKEYYERYNANPLRGFYDLAQEATARYEAAREKVRAFLNADSAEEIIFTRNTTESINLVAWTWGLTNLKPGDEILITISEHHSNILPWQMVSQRTGAKLRYIYCREDGSYPPEDVEQAFTDRVRLAAAACVSNVLGQEGPVRQMAELVHRNGGVMLADAAQAAPHQKVDVRALGTDFLAFSGHKMLAPMGIGVLWGRRDLLEDMPPFLRGGEMIDSVREQDATFAALPHKFEAGTVNGAGAEGLAAAIDYLSRAGFDRIGEIELALTDRALRGLQAIPHVRVLGGTEAKDHHGILSFLVDGVHPHDVSAILNEDRVAVRAGHHCAQPLHTHLGARSSTRASLYLYNTEEEIDRFLTGVSSIRRKMGLG